MTYLVPGTYVVKETTSASYDNYTLSGTTYNGVAAVSGTLVVGDNGGSLTVTNTYEKNAPTTGTLTIVKELSVPADKDMTFTFDVKNGNEIVNENVCVKDGEKRGRTVVENLPVGTYTVVEKTPIPAPDGYTLSGTTYYYGDGATSANVPPNGRATVTVTNTYDKLPTASETIDIPVEKVWNDNENHDNDSVTVKLLKNDEETEYTLTLNKTNNWQGSFKNVPAGGSYTVSEDPVSGYTASYIQPEITGLSVSEWGKKITPASTPSHDVTGNLLVAKKGGNYFVWTSDTLTETQQKDLMVAINNADLDGLGKSLTKNNTAFASGEKANFNDGEVTISNGTITFKETNVWSLFYCGNLTLSSVTTAIITNTPVAPKTVTVEIPVTKTVSAKPGSTLPKNLPNFTFKAYRDNVVVDTLTLELNENTKVSGAQNQYRGTLKVTISAASLTDGPVVLTIKELPGIDTKWDYDKKVYTVYVVNGQEKPELEIKLGDDTVNSITFGNTYSYK